MSIKRLKAKDKGLKEKEKNSEPQTPNSELIFILGGARSGKSGFALKLAESIKGKRLYIATAEALDDEMAKRIKKHKKERGNNWATIEEPIKIADVIKKNNPPSPPFTKGGQGGFHVILLDCLTLWISNLMHTSLTLPPLGREKGEGGLEREVNSLISACKKAKASIIIVSNEVGLGVVPDNPLARQFRDIAGFANQEIADAADEVYFMVSGIPSKIK